MIVDSHTFLKQITDETADLRLAMSGSVHIRPDWLVPQRRIQDHLFYYVIKGRIHATIEQQTIKLNAGDLLWVQPQVKQSFSPDTSFQNIHIYYMRLQLGNNPSYALNTTHTVCQPDPSIGHTWDHLSQLMRRPGRHHDIHQRSLFCDFVIQILNALDDQKYIKNGLRSDQKKATLDYIHRNIHSRFTIDDVAKHVGINTDYFARQFKKTFKITAQAYIKEERIRSACSLLSESMHSIHEVAELLGYDDAFFFSRQFKSVMKLSPRKWLNNQ
ncbi:MAG: helix-turn-helix transcriptional regulator [Planctomycetes bacterium]|nr:helix-turn-helix transcriptional regulator [Planctomycetota bacterium]